MSLLVWQWLMVSPTVYSPSTLLPFSSRILLPLALALAAIIYLTARPTLGRNFFFLVTAIAIIADIVGISVNIIYIRIICLCVQNLCMAFLMIGWGAYITHLNWMDSTLAILGAMLIASLIYLLFLAAGMPLEPFPLSGATVDNASGTIVSTTAISLAGDILLAVAIPLLTGICLCSALSAIPPIRFSPSLKKERDPETGDQAALTEERLSHHKRQSDETADKETSPTKNRETGKQVLIAAFKGFSDLPWIPLLTLWFCDVFCSFFIGLNLNPFIINSRTLAIDTAIATVVIMAAALVCLLLSKKIPFSEILVGILVCLVIGLFLFGLRLAGSTVYPLSAIYAVSFCLYALCWLFFTQISRESRLDPVVFFAIGMILCSRPLGEQIGLSVSVANGLDYSARTTIALLGCVAVALAIGLYISYTRTENRARLVAERLGLEYAGFLPLENLADTDPSSLTDSVKAKTSDSSSVSEESEVKGSGSPKSAAASQLDSAQVGRPRIIIPAPTIDAATYFAQHGLSAREVEVMLLVVQGYPNGAIAEKLYVTERTVKFHVSNSYRKLDVHSRKELMIMLEKG